MLLQRYVLIQTSGFVCKCESKIFRMLLSAETHTLLVVLSRKKSYFLNNLLSVLHHTTIQADENFHTKKHERKKKDKIVQEHTGYCHRH